MLTVGDRFPCFVVSTSRGPVHHHVKATEMGEAELLTALRYTRRCSARRAPFPLV